MVMMSHGVEDTSLEDAALQDKERRVRVAESEAQCRALDAELRAKRNQTIRKKALEEAIELVESWPLSAENMLQAESWAERFGSSHAVASVCRVSLATGLRGLIRKEG